MLYTISNTVSVQDNDIHVNHDKGSVWKEITLAFLASIPFFTHGVETLALSSSVHTGHFINLYDDHWHSMALILGAGITAPFYCYLIDKCGRKVGMYAVCLIQGASCVPLFLPPSEDCVIALNALAGISSGGLFTVLPIYIREISSDSTRGLNMSLMVAMTTAGHLMMLGMELEMIMYLMLGLVAVQLLLILVMVESPAYLVKAKKFEEAKACLGKLRCLDQNNPNLEKELDLLKTESDRATADGRPNVIRLFKNLIWRDTMKIGFVLYTMIIISGSIVFLDLDKTLVQLKTVVDPDKKLVLLCLFAGSLFCVMIIRFFDRKYILTFGHTVMLLSMGILAVYTQNDLTIVTFRWMPVVASGVLVFGYGISWGLHILIMVEVLNFEIRSMAIGILYTYSQIIKLSHVYSYPYIEEFCGIHAVFYMFAAVNMWAAVYTLFIVPTIKDKNVKQIEKQVKRVKL